MLYDCCFITDPKTFSSGFKTDYFSTNRQIINLFMNSSFMCLCNQVQLIFWKLGLVSAFTVSLRFIIRSNKNNDEFYYDLQVVHFWFTNKMWRSQRFMYQMSLPAFLSIPWLILSLEINLIKLYLDNLYNFYKIGWLTDRLRINKVILVQILTQKLIS